VPTVRAAIPGSKATARELVDCAERPLKAVDDLARIAVVHHNVRPKAIADNENVRDADDLTRLLAGHLDLLLHGHSHDGREDRLADGTLVLVPRLPTFALLAEA
jgi:hypothetical protein